MFYSVRLILPLIIKEGESKSILLFYNIMHGSIFFLIFTSTTLQNIPIHHFSLTHNLIHSFVPG